MIRLALACFVLMLFLHLLAVLIVWLVWRKLPKFKEVVWLLLAQSLAMFLFFAWFTRADAADLPADPVQRVSIRALRGDFGKLQNWQHKAYKYALAQDAKINGLAFLTHYTPREGFYRGKAVRWGMGCSERVAAAIMIDRAWYGGLPLSKRDRPGLDRSRQVWTGDYILVELPSGWQMRQILDTGAMWNLPKARKKGCNIWLDFWTDRESLRMKSWKCQFAVIRAYRTW